MESADSKAKARLPPPGKHGLVFVDMSKVNPAKRRWTLKNESRVRAQAMRFVRREKKGRDGHQKNRAEGAKTKRRRSLLGSPRRVEEERPIIDTPTPRDSVMSPNAIRRKVLDRMNNAPLKSDLHTYHLTDRELLSYISHFYMPLVRGWSPRFVLWTKGVSELMAIAFAHDFVMSTILAWSATHLSKNLGDGQMAQSALMYRSRALAGLQRAIESFSPYNSDAVLAASIVLSWQAADAATWATMVRGTAKVRQAITASKHPSFLLDPATDDTEYASPTKTQSESSSSLSSSPPPNHTSDLPLDYVIHHLAALQAYFLPTEPDLASAVNSLLTLVQNLYAARTQPPITIPSRPSASSLPPATQTALRALREFLFWIPVRFIHRVNVDPPAMLLMAHLHAVALVVAPPAGPALAAFRSLNVAPVESFREEFAVRTRRAADPAERARCAQAAALMEFPLQAVAAFKARVGIVEEGEGEGNGAAGRCLVWYRPDGEGGEVSVCTERMSTLAVLENFPVGLWHNSLALEG